MKILVYLLCVATCWSGCERADSPREPKPSVAGDLGVVDADGCPDPSQFQTLVGQPCGVLPRQCRMPACDDPCVHCVLLVCQEIPGTTARRWELNGQLACVCGDMAPSCIDPITCGAKPGC